MVLIKPHHLLDIFKLYGAGINFFIPNPLYGHDFYKIGNIILKNHNTRVKFTSGLDNICGPCKYNVNGKCTDTIPNNPLKYSSKDYWNKTIDKRVMKTLSIKEGTKMTALGYCVLAMEKLNKENIKRIWNERPGNETKRRTILLLKGLKKFSDKTR